MQNTQNKNRAPRGRSNTRNARPAPGNEKINLSSEDKSFLAEIYDRFSEFIKSDEKELVIEPYNSYKRKLVHDLALKFNIDSVSSGEAENRHNVLTKTEKSKRPDIDYKKKTEWNFSKEFLLKKSTEGVDIVLDENGNVGLYINQPKNKILDRKNVTTGSFKIIDSTIIEFNQPEWK